MKNNLKTILLSSVLLIGAIFGYFAIKGTGAALNGLNFYIYILIIILGGVALYISFRKDKERREGQPVEDELSNLIKYKAGYYAFIWSMYMWLFIFILRGYFPNTESMIGGGVLLSALISVAAKFIIKKQIHE